MSLISRRAEPQEPVISVSQLSNMAQSLDNIDPDQSGYQWRKGWNDALRQAMDYTAPPATSKDAERGRWMIKHGGWYRNDEDRRTQLMVTVPYGADLSCVAAREAAIDAAMAKGE
jgi:hypothetical protein